jgi:hypothetical protein
MRRLAFALVATIACERQPESPEVVSNQPAVALVKPASTALLAWPVVPFTKAQIAEVKRCDIATRAPAVFAKSVALDALGKAAKPKDACDQATLAQACAERLADDEDPPKHCLDAYRAAVSANPAYAFADGLPGAYFGKLALVGVPPAATRPLVAATIHYSWGGMGDGVDWTLTITDANTTPKVTVTGAKAKPAPADLKTKLATMGSALQSMLPIDGPLTAQNCFDNYPDWTATFEYEGGEKLELATHKSNLLGRGGPWQLTAGGVTYLQLGPQMLRAIADVMKALDLPAGEPMAQTCHGYDIESAVLK